MSNSERISAPEALAWVTRVVLLSDKAEKDLSEAARNGDVPVKARVHLRRGKRIGENVWLSLNFWREGPSWINYAMDTAFVSDFEGRPLSEASGLEFSLSHLRE